MSVYLLVGGILIALALFLWAILITLRQQRYEREAKIKAMQNREAHRRP